MELNPGELEAEYPVAYKEIMASVWSGAFRALIGSKKGRTGVITARPQSWARWIDGWRNPVVCNFKATIPTLNISYIPGISDMSTLFFF